MRHYTKHLATLVLTALLGILPLHADVVFDETNFPDANFRSYLKSTYSSKGFTTEGETITTANLNLITSINCSYKSIVSLKGIEYFTSLKTLNCCDNKLTDLDVSQNTALTTLYCYYNQLTELDVTQNTALTTLSCYDNQLTKLEVSGCSSLKMLYCYNNQLTALDVTDNTSLTALSCHNNQLTDLDVTQNTALTTLQCHSNQLTELDVTQNTALTSLSCGGNRLTDLDVTHNTALTSLSCGGNQLTDLDVTHNTALTSLICVNNQLTDLDVTQNTALKVLSCYFNQLTELDMRENTALTRLICYCNQLTELDLSENTRLTELQCNCNKLETLNLPNNPLLETLYCQENYLTELDVSNCTELKKLTTGSMYYAGHYARSYGDPYAYEFDNLITSLDLSNNKKITYLDVYKNRLLELDLSNNTELTFLIVTYNCLRALDLSNQKKLTDLDIRNQELYADILILSNTLLGVSYPETVDPIRVSDMKVSQTVVTFNDANINGTNYHLVSSGLTFANISSILWAYQASPWRYIYYNYDVMCGTESKADRKMDVTITIVPYVACGEDNRGDGNFPDASFRAALQNATYDQDGDGRLSRQELTELLTLDVSNMGIENLQGIEYMKYLQTLDCSGNQMAVATDLPLTYPGSTKTYNEELLNLNCSGNQLKGIDVSNNTKLQTLDCSNNKIGGTLNLSSNKSNLVELHCGNNELTGLTLPSTKTNLVKLTCNDNQLSTLSATGYTAMTLMDCSNNLLKTLTVAGNSKLETLNCSNNLLTSLTLPTTKTALLDLNCNTNQLTALSTINQYTNLTDLNCGVNKLTTLNLTGNNKLETLDCASQIDRSLVQLTLPNTTTLAEVYCNDNSLTELDLSNNTELFELDCSTNNLTALDLSANTALEMLDYSNQTRDIVAEWGQTFIDWDAQGDPMHDNFYYLRLDNNKTGIEKTIIERMTDTNYGKAASTFVPGNVIEWTSGGTVVEGTKGKNNVASVDDVRPQNVVGDILVLTDVTEQDGVANGSVSYTYNVNNDLDPDGSKGDFTLNWVTESDVVTEVTDLGVAQREPVAVEYHNLAGMVSDRPWQGVNIVVTHYSDGTVITRKMLH